MVKTELNYLEEGDVVYKLVGPILVKENHEEAKLNVDKRIEFISKEIQKQEKIFKDSESTIDNKRKKVNNFKTGSSITEQIDYYVKTNSTKSTK